MPRRSSRLISQTRDDTDSTKSVSAVKRKRSAKSLRPIRTTRKKSKYFQSDSSDGQESAPSEGSVYDDADQQEESYEEEQGESGKTTSLKDRPKGQELWREGVRTGLGPGKEVFIKKPKPRDPGNIPYQDHTIHPNTMLFLKDLKENNEREWLKAHDADYRTAKKDWDTFCESLTEKIIERDDTIPELPVKDVVFRIHRDARFSKDPTPYKPHFSAAWSRTGRKGPYAVYYVHIQPNSSFLAAGLWMPDGNQLARLRRNIDRRPQRLKAVLTNEDLRREFLEGIDDDEAKVTEAFAHQNQENALRTKPKGYESDHPNIELLRLRSFTISKRLAEDEILGPNVQDRIAELIGILVPFVTYLNSVVMPDPGQNESPDTTTDDED